MPRTEAGVRPETTARLSQVVSRHPEWQTWTRLLAVAWDAADEGRRHTLVLETHPPEATAQSPGLVPLLHGRTLEIEAAVMQDLLRDLASIAIPGNAFRPTATETLELISAAVRYDAEAIQRLARTSGVAPDALTAVAHLAAVPVLQICGRLLVDELPGYWHAGYCPVCAAWPLFAERRGLDRSRRLRCGRCAADWEVPWLFCIYCGERDHQKLGSLEPEPGGERLKVETCAHCRGYLKSVATLQGLPPIELLIRDLETVEFDLAALERDYQRPLDHGFALEIDIVDHAPR